MRHPDSILSEAAHRALAEMHEAEVADNHEDAEIVCDGGECWLGVRRVNRNTVNALLEVLAVRHDTLGGADHYTLNDTGRSILARPELSTDIRMAVVAGKPFTIENNRVVPT
jgi:hypothetical protein